MAFDYGKLKSRIVERYGSYSVFSQKMHLQEETLLLKLSNKEVWEQNEICKAVELLELKKEDIYNYFFTMKV